MFLWCLIVTPTSSMTMLCWGAFSLQKQWGEKTVLSVLPLDACISLMAFAVCSVYQEAGGTGYVRLSD